MLLAVTSLVRTILGHYFTVQLSFYFAKFLIDIGSLNTILEAEK